MNYVSQATVIDIITYSDHIKEYVLQVEKERKYNPGSFVQLSLDLVTASDIWPDSRTFSIASYEKGIMKFIIKNVGSYTNRIFEELFIGGKCSIKYPFGDLFSKNRLHENHLFLAGGVGITPYLGIIQYYAEHDLIENISLFYSVKYYNDFLHLEELTNILGQKIELFITREKCKEHHNKHIDISDIKRNANKETNIYICGSKLFNQYYKKLLQDHGYEKIHMDEWE